VSPNGEWAVSGGQDQIVRLWNFRLGEHYRRRELAVAKARTALGINENDPQALATFGDWYAFRGMDVWAAELFDKARDAGVDVPPLPAARCYWRLMESDPTHTAEHQRKAQKEFERAFTDKDTEFRRTLYARAITTKVAAAD
jgi:hypothetical protein